MKKILLIVVVVVGMNERHHLDTSLSQLDTNCTEFPDGFEETLQLQVRQYFLDLLINFSFVIYARKMVDDENLTFYISFSI